MKIDKIPIVMSFDENYAMPACVAVYSALRSKEEDTQYKFYFFVRSNMPDEVTVKFDKLILQYPNTEFEFVIVGDRLDNAVINSYFSIETYFRLLIPELLPMLDKCLYLDVDVMLCTDLTSLWNIDIGNNLIAGVKEEKLDKKRFKTLELPTPDQYISAAVLIMNLKIIRDEKLTLRFLELVTKGYKHVDQDVLNIVCYNRITFIPLKFNIPFDYVIVKNKLEKAYPLDDVEDALRNPVVIHYLIHLKPWKISDDRVFLLNLWYRTALKSPYHYDHSKNMLIGRKNKELIKIQDYRNTIEYKIGQIITFIPEILKKLIKQRSG
ncbi:MAG: glycosyltransferase family 8 protein [Oscillospiraceae bacterium]|jgi:lipopolysaccharide biosynthesis glycosyltransferase|nr:glycosyltransferase family 8 protein [Oscillospiraceae bacterium]